MLISAELLDFVALRYQYYVRIANIDRLWKVGLDPLYEHRCLKSSSSHGVYLGELSLQEIDVTIEIANELFQYFIFNHLHWPLIQILLE